MAFVNEFVSPEDFEKHGFKELNRKYRMPDDETSWTIDKGRDIYIRKISWGAPSPGYLRFHMHWKGKLFFVYISPGNNNLRSLVGMDLPKDLESFKSEIIEDLKEALQAYQGGGVWDQKRDSELEIQFDF